MASVVVHDGQTTWINLCEHDRILHGRASYAHMTVIVEKPQA
jgi:hypothetical protein